MTDDASGEVLGRDTLIPSMAKWLCPVFALNAALMGGGAATGRVEPAFGWLGLVTAAVCGFYIYASTGDRPATLTLHTDSLELRHPFRRPRRVMRVDVLSVRGDVANHPEWSTGIVVETAAGSTAFPLFGAPPVATIRRLRQWTDVDVDRGSRESR